jgi:DNA-binding response OmpR family regulator|tara:strand:+ start:1221 stop:1919 length:699 start_codon:yes stop_codon:yes gene_type:complete
MISQKSILIIEDEENIAQALKYNLTREGFRVFHALDGLSGIQLAESENLDLLVLDIMLPGIDGLDVCRQIRKTSTLPIIMLTAKVEEIDRIIGLEIGADDYVTKPFSMPELIARIKALLRRSSTTDQVKSTELESLISDDLEIDLVKHIAKIDGTTIQLKPREYDLLVFFLKNKGKAISRDEILDTLWGLNYIGDVRTVDVHIRWLRELIEKDSHNPQRLITVRGLGYRFEK